MCVAMKTRYDDVPLVSNLVGDSDMSSSAQIAQHIAHRTGQQVFVSCSLQHQPTVIGYLEKQILTKLLPP